MGNLGGLFGVVRQAAGDMRGNLRESMTSAQIKGRSEFFAELAEADELPTVGELRKMWYEMVRETTESDRKSTRLNSSHVAISYAVFCLKKKTNRLRAQRGEERLIH